MPRFDLLLTDQSRIAIGVVSAGELARRIGTPLVRKEWSISRVEFLHELAYMRIFSAWETCLESIFYRSLCGYASNAGQEAMVGGAYYPNLAEL
jgi:hypothetical protein